MIFGGTVRKQDKQRTVVSKNSCVTTEYFFGLKKGSDGPEKGKKWCIYLKINK